MKYINTFKNHSSYESEINGGVVDISLPNISYCEDVKDIHYNPYNTVEFYVGNITGTTPQTVSIYTDRSTSVDVQVSEGNKWYSYVLPKDKGLCKIKGGSVKKVVVKANISYEPIYTPPYYYDTIIPRSTIKASFKGSNTSNLTDMKWMFSGCTDITSLDVSNFNTSNVTLMGSMFSGCSGLTSLDVSNFDTSKVTDMNNMFSSCSGLTSLNLSNFDTRNVTDMSGMFNGCSNLTSLDVSRLDTSNVTHMDYMFQSCSNLTSLDVSRLDTSNVTLMGSMFEGCSSLTSLDVSRFNTSNVTNMVDMFKGCSGLTSLNLSGWNTSKVVYMGGMFKGCSKLNTITMVGCEQPTIDKIKAQLAKDNITGFTIVTE